MNTFTFGEEENENNTLNLNHNNNNKSHVMEKNETIHKKIVQNPTGTTFLQRVDPIEWKYFTISFVFSFPGYYGYKSHRTSDYFYCQLENNRRKHMASLIGLFFGSLMYAFLFFLLSSIYCEGVIVLIALIFVSFVIYSLIRYNQLSFQTDTY